MHILLHIIEKRIYTHLELQNCYFERFNCCRDRPLDRVKSLLVPSMSASSSALHCVEHCDAKVRDKFFFSWGKSSAPCSGNFPVSSRVRLTKCTVMGHRGRHLKLSAVLQCPSQEKNVCNELSILWLSKLRRNKPRRNSVSDQ